MDNLEEFKNLTTEDYNNIPVHYCTRCLSLKIKILDKYVDYCDNCGSTNIDSCHIDEWQEMYKKRFNKNF